MVVVLFYGMKSFIGLKAVIVGAKIKTFFFSFSNTFLLKKIKKKHFVTKGEELLRVSNLMLYAPE